MSNLQSFNISRFSNFQDFESFKVSKSSRFLDFQFFKIPNSNIQDFKIFRYSKSWKLLLSLLLYTLLPKLWNPRNLENFRTWNPTNLRILMIWTWNLENLKIKSLSDLCSRAYVYIFEKRNIRCCDGGEENCKQCTRLLNSGTRFWHRIAFWHRHRRRWRDTEDAGDKRITWR